MKRQALWVVLWLSALFAVVAPAAWGETVRLPITIEMPLLRSLIVQQAYPDPGEQVRVLDLAENCNQILLSAPEVEQDQGLIRFQTKIRIIWGTPVAGKCFAPLNWEGSVVLWQHPRINDQWQLSFKTERSTLLDRTGRPAKVIGLLWGLIKNHVHAYLSRIAINLAPPVVNLKEFLMPQFAVDHQEAALRFLNSMQPEQPVLDPAGLRVDIVANVEVNRQVQAEADKPVADPAAIARVMDLWQTWDALLVHLIGQLSNRPLTDQDRQLLLDTMLSMRYEFSAAVDQQNMTNDFVRGQFVSCWEQLKPIFRNHLVTVPADNLLGYLSFFMAGDALTALDRIGPAIGIEISSDGFLRLAQLISSEPVLLETGGRVDPHLRQALGLTAPMAVPAPEKEIPDLEAPPIMEEVKPAPEDLPVEEDVLPPPIEEELSPAPAELPAGTELEAPPATVPPVGTELEPSSATPPVENVVPDQPVEGEEPPAGSGQDGTGPLSWFEVPFNWSIWQVLGFPAAAWAAGPPPLAEVQSWLAERTPASILLPRVRKVLAEAAASQQARLDAPANAPGWFDLMTTATAWQESCFRQFQAKGGKISYLLSYNNTSVGLMQVNEKVWRGIYDIQDVRWNIRYNAHAGCEILALYLDRYINKQKPPVNLTTANGQRYLAAWLYALYNGGPSQVKKFPDRAKAKKFYESELLFLKKYDQAKGTDWTTKVDCLPKI
jgi:hypothetical protein